ncbi:TPA: hypothetical protein ACFP4Y_001543 [Neisseria bacilliformis]
MKPAFILLALMLPGLTLAAPAWKTVQQASGDLNGDGRADKVIIEQAQDPQKIIKNENLGAPTLNLNPRCLTVLLAGANGFQPAARATWLPAEHNRDTPCLEDPLGGDSLAVKNQVLTLNMHYWLSCGSYGVSQKAYAYRLQNGKFTLIGADSSSYMRNGGYGTAVSINFPARKIKATGYIPIFEEENGATPKPQQDRWARLKSGKRYTLAEQPPEPYELLEQSDPQLGEWLSRADGRSE